MSRFGNLTRNMLIRNEMIQKNRYGFDFRYTKHESTRTRNYTIDFVSDMGFHLGYTKYTKVHEIFVDYIHYIYVMIY